MRYVMMGAVLLLALSSCEREIIDRHATDYSLVARIEQPRSTDATKLHLVDEQWIYWEVGDIISIASNTIPFDPDNLNTGRLINVGDLANESDLEDFGYFNGVFITTLPWGSNTFLGLHPHNERNVISSDFSTVRVFLPNVQPLRYDNTFAKQVLPMVACYQDNWDSPERAYNLDFHSLGAIVRVQVYNATNTDVTLDSIVIESPNRQISGLFDVQNFTTDDPRFRAVAPPADSTRRITFCRGTNGARAPLAISLPHEGGAVDSLQMRSFYLVLPAFKGRHDSTTFQLTMKAYAGGQYCSKNFTVKTRRNNITYLNAIGLDNWVANPIDDNSIGITGNGTAARPFKIYSLADLQKLRDAYNSAVPPAKRYLNNIELTENTYITLMRSDIVLTRTNWVKGIDHFVGHFTALNHQSHPGIIDSCYNVPLFESIDEGGVVDGVTLKSAVIFNLSNEVGVSPFCTQNDGTIRNCVITTIPGSSKSTLSIFSNLGGICATNNGTIEACRFEGKAEVQSSKNFAGISIRNLAGGVITGCQISDMTVTVNGSAAGICLTNAAASGGKGAAQVRDCYFASGVSGSIANWGGIVFDNSGIVEHCYFSATGYIITTGRVGGIVKNNIGADSKVDYCWLAGPLRGKCVGGIVDSLTAGTVVNCFSQGAASVTVNNVASGLGGGIVAVMTGGTIHNSYTNDIAISRLNASATIGGIVAKATGGAATNSYTKNDDNNFYGTSSGATYTGCYLVGASQGTVAAVAATAYETLQGSLNSGRGTAKEWEGAQNATLSPATAGTPPHLKAYTQSAKRR